MKYNIITIDESRAAYKANIRSTVQLDEVYIPSINGHAVDLSAELDKRGLFVKYPGMFSTGEIGIWLSVFDCWQWAVDNNEELVTFEDDAIPSGTFDFELGLLHKELPADWAFMCLWVPDNQRIDYYYNVEYNDEGRAMHIGPNLTDTSSIFNFPGGAKIARVYNGYGNVATLYSPQGARFFIDRVREVGIYTPVDCYLYQEAHAGRCNGYAPKPGRTRIVSYDWKAKTTVHIGGRV